MHEDLLALGFEDYVDRLRAAGETQLFPELKDGRNGHVKEAPRRFNEWYLLGCLRITAPLKRLYSFRSTFITRITEIGVHPALLMAIVGHHDRAQVDLSLPHFKNYQGDKLIQSLRDVADLFDYETLLLVNGKLVPWKATFEDADA